MSGNSHAVSTDFEAVGFTLQERTTLFAEIEQVCLLLGASELSIAVSSAQLKMTEAISPLERIRVLESVTALLTAAVPRYLQRPLSHLVQEEVVISLAKSQGGRDTMRRLARSPALTSVYEQNGLQRASLREAVNRAHPQEVPLQFIVQFLEDIARSASRLQPIALLCNAHEELDCLTRVVRACRDLRQVPPLGAIPFLPMRGWDALRGALLALRGGVELQPLLQACEIYCSGFQSDFSESPLFLESGQYPWRLYEVWAFLRTAKGLVELGWKPQGAPFLRLSVCGLRLELAHGQESVVHFRRDPGETVALWYQPYFRSANQARGRAGYYSQTHAMQPDFGLESEGRWLLFDAKCKPYTEPRAEQDDINKMHTYRDAIMKEGQSVVEGAWCLFPGGSDGKVNIHAYPSSTLEQPFGRAGIGAIKLRPGERAQRLEPLLTHWLSGKKSG